MICPNCGAPVTVADPVESPACEYCGAQVPMTPTREVSPRDADVYAGLNAVEDWWKAEREKYLEDGKPPKRFDPNCLFLPLFVLGFTALVVLGTGAWGRGPLFVTVFFTIFFFMVSARCARRHFDNASKYRNYKRAEADYLRRRGEAEQRIANRNRA
jgi:hypothetical protein